MITNLNNKFWDIKKTWRHELSFLKFYKFQPHWGFRIKWRKGGKVIFCLTTGFSFYRLSHCEQADFKYQTTSQRSNSPRKCFCASLLTNILAENSRQLGDWFRAISLWTVEGIGVGALVRCCLLPYRLGEGCVVLYILAFFCEEKYNDDFHFLLMHKIGIFCFLASKSTRLVFVLGKTKSCFTLFMENCFIPGCMNLSLRQHLFAQSLKQHQDVWKKFWSKTLTLMEWKMNQNLWSSGTIKFSCSSLSIPL